MANKANKKVNGAAAVIKSKGAPKAPASERTEPLPEVSTIGVKLPLSSVYVVEGHNPRSNITEAEIKALAISIRERGQLQPIVVGPRDKTGRHPLIAGERRYRAIAFLGRPTVDAVIRDAASRPETDATDVAIVENVHREALSTLDTARWVAAQIAAGRQRSDLAKVLGKTPSFVSQLLGISNMAPSIIEAMEKHPEQAPPLRVLTRIYPQPHDAQVKLWDFYHTNGRMPDAAESRAMGLEKAPASTSSVQTTTTTTTAESTTETAGATDEGPTGLKRVEVKTLVAMLAQGLVAMGLDPNDPHAEAQVTDPNAAAAYGALWALRHVLGAAPSGDAPEGVHAAFRAHAVKQAAERAKAEAEAEASKSKSKADNE